MTSTNSKIKLIAGLAGTKDVDARTSRFIEDMVEKTGNGARCGDLTEAQLQWIEDIHKRHFG